MDRFDQKKITKNLAAINKTIEKDVLEITIRLHAEKVLSDKAKSEVENADPKKGQLRCGLLVNHLLRSGPDTYGAFVKVLRERKFIKLIDAMENSVQKGPCIINTNEREQTFVISQHKKSAKLNVRAIEEDDSDENGTNGLLTTRAIRSSKRPTFDSMLTFVSRVE
ncbi:hypothetical protein DPMN_063077 [Dreissena polymorpha]|uniref:CARD domain-containing protein n=1 Tax=Dreissena polymorpha TaxID=45954 RepID=A0A9D4HJW9_DREPO|nr:hypothetical protein DPMN_063077 [Dreissena polymorpha]